MKEKKRYVHKNVSLLFYILFTVAGIVGSIVFVNHFELNQYNSLLLRSPTSPVSIIPYLIFFLGVILSIYFYWDIMFPNETLVKIIYKLFFIIWIILVLLFGFVFPIFAFNDYLILIMNLIIISPIIIIIAILANK